MIEYRKATTHDCDALAKIRVDFLTESNNVIGNEEMTVLYENNRQFFLDSIGNGSFIAWLATYEGEIIATSGISFYKLPPNKKCPSGNIAYIGNMFTYPPYRKKGIASCLFELTVNEAGLRGCSKILLNATEQGRPLYEKFGFKILENDMVYYLA